MVAVRILLVVLCLFLGENVSFGRVALVLAMVWATGIFAVGLLWSSVAASTSALVIKAGLYALQEFSVVLVLRHCCKHPKDVYYVGGLVMCVLMGAHVSRLGMLLVFSNAPVMGGAVGGGWRSPRGSWPPRWPSWWAPCSGVPGARLRRATMPWGRNSASRARP